MARTLTSANSIFYLSIPGVYSSPQKIQGYSTDDMWDLDALKPTEVMMGVDGRKSSGFTPVLQPQSIVLQADSASNDIFDAWFEALQQAFDDYPASGTLRVPGLGISLSLTNGSLTGYKRAGAGKTMKPRTFGITWESVTRGSI